MLDSVPALTATLVSIVSIAIAVYAQVNIFKQSNMMKFEVRSPDENPILIESQKGSSAK